MRHERNWPPAVLLILVAVLLAALVAYVGGYFWLGEVTAAYSSEDTWVTRRYPSKGLAIIFHPLASVESWITGWDVEAVESVSY